MKQFCFKCHSNRRSKADINLEALAANNAFAADFKQWERVTEVLEAGEMPPEDVAQPSEEERRRLLQAIRGELQRAVNRHAGDPGRVVLRRLTSAEYAYSIEDLTGLNLGLEKSFLDEAVGGEGFSNVGDVQFVQDSAIERFLDAAKIVASHAVIGAGPIAFYQDPGKTGQELSAIHRINRIYREHGFRTGAGEGAEAFGLEKYPNAFHAAWRYRHRDLLGDRNVTLATLAQREGLSVRFLEHIWSVLSQVSPSFPSSVIVQAWRDLPTPGADGGFSEDALRKACRQIYALLAEWQKALAANAEDDEEAPVLSGGTFQPILKHDFRVRVNWPADTNVATLELSVIPAGSGDAPRPAVIWKEPKVYVQLARRAEDDSETRRQRFQPLREVVSEESAKRLGFGQGRGLREVAPNDFMTLGAVTLPIQIPVPVAARRVFLRVEAELDPAVGDDCLVRCVVSDGILEEETVASTGAASALLANPASPHIGAWQTGIATLARTLPQVSHREAAPSDRDPIPAPFDNTYNTAERNSFHYIIKYHRDDAFLSEYILDDATREALDQAWTDLMTSFAYHDTFLEFVARKFALDLGNRSIATIDQAFVDAQPDAARVFVGRLYRQHRAAQARLRAAQSGHVDDAIRFARQAWRRPLSHSEEEGLRAFYAGARREHDLSHVDAMRALLVRLLMAPAFLYRSESPPAGDGIVALSDWELASRLSYFLWSSMPDETLQRAAAAGELRDPDHLSHQAMRMLGHKNARRLATEFFGQWFGFYRFVEFRGIDTDRFSEFDHDLKSAMYDEAISFFEHIVREDRPIDEILFADYTFLNERLAKHYDIELETFPENRAARVEKVGDMHRHRRGGLLQLGAVLATTSAPLRTSAVKRGDWIVSRVLGTPVPPPPADAGFIPPDDVLADGLTVRERLEAHRSEASCVNCHSRIDPLGFALEHYDPLGRWRSTYRDGRAIDTTGILNTGRKISGREDLIRYLKEHRSSFYQTLCVKLLGYALGRGVMLSDRPLLDRMTGRLASSGRLSQAVTEIVTSSQFRHQRGRDAWPQAASGGEVASVSKGTGP